MLLMVEKGIGAEIYYSIFWYAKANDKYMKYFDKNKEFKYCLYVLAMSRTRFRVNSHSIVAWMSRNPLLEAGAKSEG